MFPLFTGTCFYNGLFSSCVVYAHIYVSVPLLTVSIILEKVDNDGRFSELPKMFAISIFSRFHGSFLCLYVWVTYIV